MDKAFFCLFAFSYEFQSETFLRFTSTNDEVDISPVPSSGWARPGGQSRPRAWVSRASTLLGASAARCSHDLRVF